jgi:membrane-anchored protein YejM (alkaline phosphatase superfamily)
MEDILPKFSKYNLHLNEIRKNLAANPERSPLMHSYYYASACDRPALFARRVPAPHPFGATAKNRSRRFFARFSLSFVPFMQYTG